MAEDPLSHAITFFRDGDLAKAEASCAIILQRNPGHAEANHLLGAIRFQQGRTAEAIAFLKRAAASPLATAEIYNHLGSAHYKLGERKEARDAFERALAMKPGFPEALHNLGVIYSELQKPTEAADAFREAVRQDPNLVEASAGLNTVYSDIVPPWHFAMLGDEKRNSAYEAAIRKAVGGKHVLEIGTGAGLLALMAARAGAASVTTCETIPLIAERAREIVSRNGFADRIRVVTKKSTLLDIPADMLRRAEVLITETFASGLITEGVLLAIEHAHPSLITPEAVLIPRAASVMGYLAGGSALEVMLFADRVAGFDLSPFNEFGPPMLPANLDHVPHAILSNDVELMRFDFRQKQFPAGEIRLAVRATAGGMCAGVVQWIRLELDSATIYENRPSARSDFAGHWSHIVHRFPKPIAVEAGDVLPISFRHDRSQIAIRLVR
jgi:type II protein arginine methyltransferase